MLFFFYIPPTSIDPHVDTCMARLSTAVASDNTVDVEINNRTHAASGAFGGLWKRVWSQHGITVSTNCKR